MSAMLSRADLPPVWLALHALAAAALDAAAPLARFQAGPWPGGLLIAAGAALIGWSALQFALRRTPIEPRHAPKALITGGPFRLNRNPIYTGMAIMLAGGALLLGSLGAVLPLLVFPVVITRRFILGEEAALREAFGEEAEAWIARSRRW
ncbi:MAG: methyltransferase [Pseudomonadota bacterium]